MALWKRTLLVVGLIAVIGLAVEHMALRSLVSRRFSDLEHQEVQRDVERVLQTIQNDVRHLDTVVGDWAAWDDTYGFMSDRNDDYVESNLVTEAFTGLGLNAIVLVDSAGEIVYGKSLDLESVEEMAIAELSQEGLHADHLLLDHPTTESSVSGVFVTSGGPMIISSRPILTSEEEGPIHGTLMMAYFIDEGVLERWSEIVQRAVAARLVDDLESAPDFQLAHESLTVDEPVFVRPLDETSVAAYAMLRDVRGDPVLMLRVEQSRDMRRYGEDVIRSISIATGVGGVVLALAFVLAMKLLVVSRVDELARAVRTVGDTGDLGGRVPVQGGDELAELAGAINGMLDDLEQADADLLQSERHLLALVKAAQTLLAPSAEVRYEPFLEVLGLATGASRAHIFLNGVGMHGHLVTSLVAQWCAEGIESQMDNPTLQRLPVTASGFRRWADVLRRGEAINGIVADLPASERPLLEAQGAKAVLVLPLMVDGNAIGMIGFDRCTEAREWLAPEVDMLRIASADLIQALQRQRSDQVRAATYKISEVARGTEDLPELYRAIHEIVGELMPAGNFYIALYDRTSQTVRFPYYADAHDQAPEPQTLGKGLTEYVLRTGEALLASPEVFEELVRQGEVESLGAPSVDWLGVPLRTRDEAIGVLVVQTYSEAIRLGEEEKDILAFVATQVATAIQGVRAEAELRASEARYRTIFETTASATAIVEKDMTISLVNKELVRLSGYAKEELEGKKRWTEFVAPRDLARMKEYHTLRRDEPGAMPRGYEFRFVDRQGGGRDVFLTVAMIPGTGKSVASLLDITDRKQEEEQLRESEEKYRAILGSIEEAYYEVDVSGNFTFFNDSLRRLLGYSEDELMGMGYRQYLDEHDAKKVYRAFIAVYRTGEPAEAFDWQIIRKDGTRRFVEASVSPMRGGESGPVGFRGIVRDITDRRQAEEEKARLEEQLRQAQKMEAVGLLAGGVAHEFNNMLTVILGNAELGLMQEEAAQPLRKELRTIQRAAKRAAELTKQLLAFSRRQMLQVGPVDLNELLRGFVGMVERLIGEHIAVEMRLADGLELVQADGNALEQALMNLALNARDAMPDGGQLQFETASADVDEAYCEAHADAKPGEYVRLSVSDTGAGMNKETLEHLFEPFFTTKEVGEGTGLGLSMVYGVVKQHGGWIEVESKVGAGTRFKMYLPVWGEKGEAGKA